MESAPISQLPTTSLLQPSRPHTALTIKQMYMVVDQNSNLQWQTLNYRLPKRYHSAKQIKKNQPNKKIQRTSYLNGIQALGKKIPGVGQYNVEVEDRKTFSKWDGKCKKRKTIIEEAFEMSRRAATPGPASYFQRNRSEKYLQENSSRKNTFAMDRTSYLNEVEYLAVASPGTGQYNLAGNILKSSFKSSSNSRPTSSKIKRKVIKMSEINPIIDGTFSKAGFVKKIRPGLGFNKNTFGKENRFLVSKDRMNAPAPNKYKFEKCVNSTLIPTRSIYY